MTGPIAELPEWARSLLEEQRVARLGLLDEGDRPTVLPITFAVRDEHVWSAVDDKPKRDPGRPPARLRRLRRRPEVALTVDRYDDDWDRLAWVQLLGRASVLPIAEHPDAVAALAARYPQYEADPPPGPLIRIEPERAIRWRASEPA